MASPEKGGTGRGGFRETPQFRGARRRVLTRIQMVNARDETIDVMVRDISARGLSAAARGVPPGIDEIVKVHLPDRRVLWGMVRWVEKNLFGVEFDVNSSDEAPGAGEAAMAGGGFGA